MIRGYSAQQMRDAEAPHLAAGEPLMQRAAAGLAEEVRRALPATGGKVLLLVGTGNNGADALYAGAELAAGGADVAIVTTGPRVHEHGLATALAAGSHTIPLGEAGSVAEAANVVVDGILGTGTSASPALRGHARTVVEAINGVRPAPFVVAVDIPSGINPDDGSVPDPLVLPADVTVTFGGYKAGLLLAPGAGLAGRVRVIDIGLGADLAALTPTVTLPG